MSRIPVTTTGLARLRPEPQDLIIQTSEGQTIRLKPGRGPGLSQEGQNTLFGGEAPPDAPEIFSGAVGGGGVGSSEEIAPPTGYNEMNNPLQESNRNALINQARRGDKRAAALLEFGDRETRRITAQKVAAERQEISRQTQAANKERDRAYKFIADNKLPLSARAEVDRAIIAQFPKAGAYMPDPSGFAFLEELKENRTLLESEAMRATFKAFEGDEDAAAKAQMYWGMLHPDNPDIAMKVRDQISQEKQNRRTDLGARFKQRTDDIKRGSRFSFETQQTVDTWMPFDARVETTSAEYGLDAKNPFDAKTDKTNWARFERAREAGKLREADAIIRAQEEIYGPAPVDDTPEAVESLQAAIARQAEAMGETLPGGGPPPGSLSPEAARRAFQSGQLLPGQPFLGENGRRYRYSAVTGKPELVE